MIKAVIFDCFGVLYRDNLSILYDAVPEDKWLQLKDIIHAADHGFLDRDEYQEAIAELADIPIGDVKNIERQQHERDESMLEYVRVIRKKYKTGLLSNIDTQTVYKLFSDIERADLFDNIVISAEVGITKPSVEIYELAASHLGVVPEECVVIDDIERNVVGAELAGMRGVLFTSRVQLERDMRQIINA